MQFYLSYGIWEMKAKKKFSMKQLQLFIGDKASSFGLSLIFVKWVLTNTKLPWIFYIGKHRFSACIYCFSLSELFKNQDASKPVVIDFVI